MKKKILSVIGTRPEAIKMAALLKELAVDQRFESRVLVTAQHREMLDQVLDFFQIGSDYDLDLMQHGQTLPELTSRLLLGVSEVLDKWRPDLVVVHGDTATTLAASLAAFYAGVPVAHIEAGMRTGDKQKPFPEEMNRVLVADLATWHFAPSSDALEKLLKEGVARNAIVQTQHNTGIDSLHLARRILQDNCSFNFEESVQEKEKYVLITAHRRESWGPKMREIFLAIARLARLKPEVRFELATHTNPIVADDAEEILSSIPNVSLLKHQGYADFVQKMAGAELILSDSGGIQEEGPSLGVPVLVLRDKTEYQELIDAGLILLAGTDKEGIEDTFLKAFADRDLQQKAQAFARIRSSESSVKLIVERLATLEASA